VILIGWMMRAIILGAKFDECRTCHVPGPHLVLRKTHWFTIFRIPVVLLWLQHGILCPACGDYSSISFLKVGRAFRNGRLPINRERPIYEATVRESMGITDPADWAALGLAPNSSPDALKTRWHELAKQLHPDVGGDTQAFVQMQEIYRRLASAPGLAVGSMPDPAEIFDPVIKNPKRGFFDAYLKAWIVVAVMSTAISGLQTPRPATPPTSGSTPLYPAAGAVVISGETAHTCWANGTTLIGCKDDTSSLMLFGNQLGTRVTCMFIEPLGGQSARCR
jgi:hypothetical protein